MSIFTKIFLSVLFYTSNAYCLVLLDYWLIYQELPHMFLSAFAKFRKTTISFVTSVCLSVRPHLITRLPLDLY